MERHSTPGNEAAPIWRVGAVGAAQNALGARLELGRPDVPACSTCVFTVQPFHVIDAQCEAHCVPRQRSTSATLPAPAPSLVYEVMRPAVGWQQHKFFGVDLRASRQRTHDQRGDSLDLDSSPRGELRVLRGARSMTAAALCEVDSCSRQGRKRIVQAHALNHPTPALSPSIVTTHPNGAEQTSLSVKATLRGKRLLLTGATGFLGKAILEKLLWAVPEIGSIALLVRESRQNSAAERVAELLDSSLTLRLRARHGRDWLDWAMARLVVISGDISRPRFGLSELDFLALAGSLDGVIGSAASVVFDERLDRSLATNIRGVQTLLELCGDSVPLLHISTCYVSGQHTELRGEAPLLFPQALALWRELERTCDAIREGTPEPGCSQQLVDAGMRLAKEHGFRDTYTLTKAIAEVLVIEQGATRRAILRPSIIESAWSEPAPGWIDGVRMADPILLSYGRSQLHSFPGTSSALVDLVPVDFVASAALAALSGLLDGSELRPDGAPPIYQVGSSSSNPLTLSTLADHAKSAFSKDDVHDWGTSDVPRGKLRLVESKRFFRGLSLKRWLMRASRGIVFGSSRFAQRLGAGERTLDQLTYLARIYSPYLLSSATYGDAQTRRLWHRLNAEERELFAFDVTVIDWKKYFEERHIPGLRRFVLGNRPPRTVTVAPEHAPSLPNTIVEAFEASASAHPSANALQISRRGKWLRYSYLQARLAADHIAQRLWAEHGIREGDRVGICADNGPEWSLTAIALLTLGAVVVPIDPQWPAEEVQQALEFVGARTLCMSPRFHGELQGSYASIVLDSLLVPEPGAPRGELSFERAVPSSSRLAAIFFTSGTTVEPKAVPLTNANFMANARAVVGVLDVTCPRVLAVLPAFHVVEFLGSLVVPLAIGGSVTFVERIDGEEILRALRASGSTTMTVVPRILELFLLGIEKAVASKGVVGSLLFRAMLRLSGATRGELGRLLFRSVHARFGGHLSLLISVAAALPKSTQIKLRNLGFNVVQAYGMTETSPVISMDLPRSVRPGSVGKPLPGVEVRVDHQGSALPQGASPPEGEILVRGPNVMSGYLTADSTPGAGLQDGWLHTGDVGFLDRDGYLTLTGRKKEVILGDSGKNVYPQEVEFRYRRVPGVRELCVVGVPDPLTGHDTVCAVVVPDGSCEQAQIERGVAELSRNVPSHQRVQRIHFRTVDIPKTSTLKFRRAEVVRELLEGEPVEPRTRRGVLAGREANRLERPALNAKQSWILTQVADLAGVSAKALDPTLLLLADLGLDSLARVQLVGRIEQQLGVRLADAEIAAIETVAELLALANRQATQVTAP